MIRLSAALMRRDVEAGWTLAGGRPNEQPHHHQETGWRWVLLKPKGEVLAGGHQNDRL
jgi:hypothetical protein